MKSPYSVGYRVVRYVAIGGLTEKARALLMDKQTGKKYCPLALGAATYLLNRTPHESLGGGVTPREKHRGEDRSQKGERVRMQGLCADT